MTHRKPFLLIVQLALVAGLLLAFVGMASADLLEEVKKEGVLTIGTEARFPPFEFVEDGNIVGYSADMLAVIEKEISGVEFKRLDVPWQGILPGLEAGKFDYIVTSVTATNERFHRYHLSVPIADATMALLVRSDSDIQKPEDISGKAVGSQTGSAQLKAVQNLSAELEAAGKAGAKEFKEYVDFNEAYADLAAGRIAAVSQSFPNLADAVKKRPDTFRIVKPTFGPKKYFCWAARKDAESAALANFFDEQLVKLIESGKMGELQKKWFGFEMPVPTELPEPE